MFQVHRRSGDRVSLLRLFLTLFGLTLVIILVPSAAAGQQRATSAGAELLLSDDHLDQIVVTASRVAMRSGEAPSAVTVFTDKDIREMGAQTLMDVLRYAPGLEVFETNRSTANVSIRGFNQTPANKLLVMIDGRSIYQDYSGSVLWFTEPLLLARIKRVEIVRGPGSALYGANAFLGVINIITKTPHELANATSKTILRSSFGDQGSTYNELLTSTSTTSGWDFTFGAAYRRTDGFLAGKADFFPDHYRTPMLTFDAQKKMRRGSLIVSLGNSEATADFGYSANFALSALNLHTSYAQVAYNEEGVKNPLSARIFGNFSLSDIPGTHLSDSATYDVEIQKQHRLSDQHNLVYGATYRHIDLGSAYYTGSQPHQQELYAFYVQDAMNLSKKTELFAGIRLDQNSLYGFNITPRVSMIHRLAADQSLRLSYGTAFHAPTLTETYSNQQISIGPGLNVQLLGNPNLEPERVTNYEIGYRHQIRGGYVALNAYHNRLSGLISTMPVAFAPSPPFPQGIPTEVKYLNATSAQSTGFEIESQFQIGKRIHGLINYAFQDVHNDVAIANFSPRNKLNVGVAARLSSRWDAYLGVHYMDATTFQINNAPIVLPPYVRVDARLGYRFGTARHPITVSLSALNLFDSSHLEYPQTAMQGQLETTAHQRRSLFFMFEGKF